METVRLTMAQALVRYLAAQRVARDGVEQPFFAGVFGIFGHGNLAGVGEALQAEGSLRYVPVRNEQAGVHAAVAWARTRGRLSCWACTSSIGPGATNMVTGAALATINRLPVLLLPGDIFARRGVGPVLQQLEADHAGDLSVNDCFRPVSRYFDRIWRPEQLLHALPEALRVLTSPADTGAVTLALPQDVQAEAWDYPAGFFRPRTWHVPRTRPDLGALERAVALVRGSRRPLVVAGGGVAYAGATAALRAFAEATGVPVAVTQAGKGTLPDDHPLCAGALGVTGTRAANRLARTADVVIGVGTRYSDFTTASKTIFQDPGVRFVNLNVAALDAAKHGGEMLLADARAGLDELADRLGGWRVSAEHAARVGAEIAGWRVERAARVAPTGRVPPGQAEVLEALNRALGPEGVVVNAAGSAPGDLHQLWVARDPVGYHVEYGYSCMGYEIPAGMGIALAAPEREVWVVVGDGSLLMLPGDLATLVQERVPVRILVVDNHGFGSIGGLSRAVGSGGFGTAFRTRGPEGALDGPVLPLDLAGLVRSLGVPAFEARGLAELEEALATARRVPGPAAVVVETDPSLRVPGCEAWWDVPVAEVSPQPEVRAARAEYEQKRGMERHLHALDEE